MRGTYITIEIILTAALMRFGEKFGTHNMWFVIVAIIVSHFIMELLYTIRTHIPTKKTNKISPANKEPYVSEDTVDNNIDVERNFYNYDNF